MSHVHLGLHCLEVIGLIGLDLAAHSLAAPLPEAIELSIHREGVLIIMDKSSKRLNNDIYHEQESVLRIQDTVESVVVVVVKSVEEGSSGR